MTATLSSLDAPLRVLRLFAAEFPHLPAPCVRVTTIFPGRLELSFHDDFAGFEAWRDALGIAPESVSHGVQGGGCTRVLEAESDYAGALLRLVGFAKIPAADVERSRAEAAS
ncbi:hypothetical protein OG753_21305 [Streptomyces sp. NBC_00029]|uniref:hypothetical protein n=1 Tax=Streptomyces sp. NBC_00029 TaxID=2903613 RepID=UPI003245A3B6